MLFHEKNTKEDIELFNKSKFSLLSFGSEDIDSRVKEIYRRYDTIVYLNVLEFIFRLVTSKREIDFV